MKNEVIHLIRYAKANGCVISVNDGEAWPVKRSTNETEILEAVNSVDEATIRVVKMNEQGGADSMGVAFIVNGLDPDELVADHSVTPWFDGWRAAYAADNQQQVS